MPSLTTNTSWTLSGNVENYNTSNGTWSSQLPAVFKITVSQVVDCSTSYSEWNGFNLVSGYGQQYAQLTVTKTINGVQVSSGKFIGNFKKGTQGESLGQGVFTNPITNEILNFKVITNLSVCSGKQAAQAEYSAPQGDATGTIQYGPVMGYTCRN